MNNIHVSASCTSLAHLARQRLAEQRWLRKNGVLEHLVLSTARATLTGELDARNVANVAYGAARSGIGKSLVILFVALARAAEPRLGEFNAQDLANTAWAFATAGQ